MEVSTELSILTQVKKDWGDTEPVLAIESEAQATHHSTYVDDWDSLPTPVTHWHHFETSQCNNTVQVRDNILDPLPQTDPKYLEFVLQQRVIKPDNGTFGLLSSSKLKKLQKKRNWE